MKALIILIKKEITLEWRNLNTLMGVLLYLTCTVFALYMMMGKPESRVWNGLFWVAQLFIVVNAVSKSFLEEGQERNRYYYTLVSPWKVIISKIIYNYILLSLIGSVALFLFYFLLGSNIEHFKVYFLVANLGVGALSILFTFLSSLAAQTGQGAAMMAILGFPLAIPLIMILSKISLTAIAAVFQENLQSLILFIIAMKILIVGLAYVLFPFLWKE